MEGIKNSTCTRGMHCIPKSSFTEAFVRLNRLDAAGFRQWKFLPGMEFESLSKWWSGPGIRPEPHEGLDICCFENSCGQVVNLEGNSLVPVLFNGMIARIFPDILGDSILVSHDLLVKGKRVYSIYAHTVPLATTTCGNKAKAGEPIAKICPTGKKSIRPHLHLSVILASEAAIINLDWLTIQKTAGVIFLDPLAFL